MACPSPTPVCGHWISARAAPTSTRMPCISPRVSTTKQMVSSERLCPRRNPRRCCWLGWGLPCWDWGGWRGPKHRLRKTAESPPASSKRGGGLAGKAGDVDVVRRQVGLEAGEERGGGGVPGGGGRGGGGTRGG